MEIQAFVASRPTTNLVPNEKYQLTKAQTKSGFMGTFNRAYSGDPRKSLLKVALGAIMDTSSITLGKPPKAVTQEERAARKHKATRLRDYEEARNKMHLAQYTKLRKVNGDDPHFVLTLPIAHFQSTASLDTLLSLFGHGTPDNDAIESLRQLFESPGTKRFGPSLALSRAHLPKETSDLFGQSLIAVSYQCSKNLVVASLEFKVTRLEAEALISTDWLEIRPVDLYPLFAMWVEAEYVSKNYGKSAISLSKIAKTLPPQQSEDRRTDKYGLTIDMFGQPLYLPQECDNTEKYESLYAAVGSKDDGEFSLMDVESQDVPTLPSNIPILTDWVNFKFTYSNSAGRPVIMPLENMRKCTPSMAVNVLNRHIPDKYIERLANYASVVGVSLILQRPITSKDTERLDKVFRGTTQENAVTLFKNVLALDVDITPRFRDLVDGDDIVFEPFRQFIMALVPAMQNNIEALYSRYAVSTVTEALGMLCTMLYYGVPMGETLASANQANAAAQRQGIDPNWTPPDMPLITKKFEEPDAGMLPHQAKIRNLLRESPDFAVLAVDAGGGKSMLAITDVLYEIKEKRSAPYLIMCPSHLVANYVAELVEFTDGKLNVIPVTSDNIRTTGYVRYEQILSTAPLNTVLVVDYRVLQLHAKSAVYGTTAVSVFPVVEMIRKFRPGYCMLDESHTLKNANSKTFKSVMNLIADIPKKRIASGTLNPDSPSDLPSQLAIMDPTIFGTREDFNNTYGEIVNGQRVIKWRSSGPNSIGTVMAKLKQNIVWCPAKRKEWACALPERRDHMIPVELSPKQRDVYNAIFDDMVLQIRKKAETNKTAKKLLENLTGIKASKGDEDDFGDMVEDGDGGTEDYMAEGSDDVGSGLQPYLADIERFVTNPAFHAYARNGFVAADGTRVAPLTGDDLKSPKAAALEHLLLNVYNVMDPSSGKALVFVNYNESADSMFAAMPPALQACGILYKTNNKTELVNKFKTDPKVRWMIGIRTSLEVGLNFQVASSLVRLEGVWTPGQQEQGDSRIARPYFGPGGDKRVTIRFDTIIANRTIDVTKAARLRAKMVALAKFENTGNPEYEALQDIPLLPMKLSVIQSMNDFDTNLWSYNETMRELGSITKREYAEYRKKIEAEGGFKFTQVTQAPVPDGCAIMSRVPYAHGTELYKASELGLVRVDNYLGQDLSGEDDEESAEGDNELDDESADTDLKMGLRDKVIGLPCHTEYGDGIIVKASFSKDTITRVSVRLNNGTTANRVHVTSAFIITRTETNSIDMRNKLQQASGLKVTAEITVPGNNLRQTRITMKEQRETERRKEQEIKERQRQSLLNDKKKSKMSIALQLNVVNGYLQVGFLPDTNPRAVKAIEALGFKQNPSYYYTRIRTFKHLIAQAQTWADAGFHVGDHYDSGALAALSVALTQNGLQSHKHYSVLMTEAKFRNYMRDTFKPTSDKQLLNLFALVTDGGWSDPLNLKRAGKKVQEGEPVKPAYGLAYLCMPAGGGHPGSKLAIQSKYIVPGTRWRLSEPLLTRFVGSLAGVHKVLAQLKEAGITVNNIDQLNQYARSVKRIAPKVDDTVFNPKEEADIEIEEEAPKKRRVKEKVPVKKRREVTRTPVKTRK